MILYRHWVVLLLAGGLWLPSAHAQESEPAPAPPPPTTGFEPPPSPGASSSFGASPGASSSFGPTTPPSTPSGVDAPAGPAPGVDPGLGVPSAATELPASFTLPGFYGGLSNTFTAGEGRLARPKFRTSVSLSQGYDDNVLQTPTDSPGVPDQVVEVLVDPGTPDQTLLVPETRLVPVVGSSGGVKGFRLVPTGRFNTRIIPGTPPKTDTVIIPGVPAQERLGSLFTRFGGNFETQFYTQRSLFTLDLGVDASYYLDRPGSRQTDYNGTVLLSFLYKVTPRLQFTTQINAAYLSQPDFNRINTPQNVGVGDYISGNWKTDLSYRWTPRVTSVLSITDTVLYNIEKTSEAGNYNDVVVGSQLRYLWSPRFTFVGEGRYSMISYPENPTLNSNTAFLLLGSDVQLSRRFIGTVRVGQSFRTFDESGDTATTPYMENMFSWRAGPASLVGLSTRFGFEEPSVPSEERVVLRLGLSFSQAFSARFNASASLTYLHQQSTTEASDVSTTQDTFDTSLRLQYTISRHFSLNASYTFTDVRTSVGFQDYYRNRFFVGGQYTF